MDDFAGSTFPGLDKDFYQVMGIPNGTGSPERRLLPAILERAILDFVGNDSREVEESEAWLFGELDEPSFERFSFSWVCEQLDLDMFKIANRIRSMPRRGNRRVAPWYFTKAVAQTA